MAYNHDDPKKNTKTRNGSNLKQNNIEPGSHSITVFEILKVYWSKKELKVDESVDATIETVGYKAGTVVSFSFQEMSGLDPERNLGNVDAKISGNKATVSWKYPVDKEKKTFAQNYNPSVYFKVAIASKIEKSPCLPIHTDLIVKLESETGKPVSGAKVEISLSSGKFVSEKTDNSGMVKVVKVPPGCHKVKFPEAPTAERKDDIVADPFQKIAAKLNAFTSGGKVNSYHLVSLYYYCLHKIADKRRCVSNTSVFEVVPDIRGDDKYKDAVTILSHDKVSPVCNGKALEELPMEGGKYAYKLVCEQLFDEQIPQFWKKDFWTGLVKPKEFAVTGLPKSLTVKCYRPDTFKVQIEFPPLAKEEIGSQYVNSIKNVTSNVIAGEKPYLIKNSEMKISGWGNPDKWPMPASTPAPLYLSRNDVELKLNFLKAVGAVIELATEMDNIINKIIGNVPKVGWYYKKENQFWQGTFVVEWGWKEFTDHRAYYYIGANIDLKLIEAKFEIGVGVEVGPVALQVYGTVKGAVVVSVKGARISPDNELEISVPFGGEIMGGLGARAKASSFVNLEGVAEFGLKVNDGAFRLSTKEGFKFTIGLQFTGINVKITATSKGKKQGEEDADEKGSGTRSIELVGSYDLAKWEFPQPNYTYNPPAMAKEDFHKMFVRELEKGNNIRVLTAAGYVKNNYLSPEEVASFTESWIHQKKGLDFECKKAEGMVIKIRDHLGKIMDKGGGLTFKHMTMERFNQFLSKGELKAILNGYIDNVKVMINANS